MKGNNIWLAAIGGALGLAILIFILYSQTLQTVTVSQPLGWNHTPITIGASSDVQMESLITAVDMWKQRGYPFELCAPSAVMCDIEVSVNPLLDTRDSVEDSRFTHGLTTLVSRDGFLDFVTVEAIAGDDILVWAHELGHTLGYEHPVNPPTGHIMHPTRPSLNDWRGIEKE